ncbi:MBL fold metallo-hydrolase [Elusimicrobiota bacterium]
MKITVIYDNRGYEPDWETGWGFSALIENNDNEKLLFDTGDNADKLVKNLSKSSIDIKKINALTFSHADWDHKDGAEGFLKVNGSAYVYIPHSFPEEFRNMVEKKNHRYTLIGYSKNKLIKNVFSTPVFTVEDKPEEQGIIVQGSKGLALITGCAHPGILYMVMRAKEIFEQEVRMILGGFHLKELSIEDTNKLIDDLKKEGVEYFAPCHCTGEKQIGVFKKECGDGFIKIGAGKVVKFN